MATRDLILRTALEVFAERGTDGASMREIARRTGRNIATAYHHFGSKRGLILAVFDELGWTDAIDAWVPRPRRGKPEAVLTEILAETWTIMDAGRSFMRVLCMEAVRGDEDVRAIAATFREKGQRNLEESLVHAGLANRRTAPARATAVRQVIWGRYVESLMSEPLDRSSIEDSARTAARALIASWACGR